MFVKTRDTIKVFGKDRVRVQRAHEPLDLIGHVRPHPGESHDISPDATAAVLEGFLSD